MAKLQISRSDYECIEHPPAPYINKDGDKIQFAKEWTLNKPEGVYETEPGVLRFRVLPEKQGMILIHRSTVKVVAGLKLPKEEAVALAKDILTMYGEL